MIIRARPKFLNETILGELFTGCTNNAHNFNDKVDDNRYYFNYGRTALQFILACYSKYLERQITIGIQDFNCSVVLDAILNSNNKAYLMDINRSFFSIDIENAREVIACLDVLILTHYQGIPNPHYHEFAELCLENDVLLIEDSSQTVGSTIRGAPVGSLAPVSLESFSFDKPFTCFEGGALKINDNLDKAFRSYLSGEYNLLNEESLAKVNSDFKSLTWLFYNTTPQKYFYNFSLFNIHILFYLGLPIFAINCIIKGPGLSNYVGKILQPFYNRFLGHPKQKQIKKLGSKKIKLIKLQQQLWQDFPVRSQKLDKLSADFGLNPIKSNSEMQVCWNRYSILDKPDGRFKSFCLSRDIECGNYNWPITLHEQYKSCPLIIYNRNGYKESIHCSRHVLNLPFWLDLDL